MTKAPTPPMEELESVSGLEGLAVQKLLAEIAEMEHEGDHTLWSVGMNVGEWREVLGALARLEAENAGLRKYAELGKACERHGLGWFAEDGSLLFQPPADYIAEQAAEAVWAVANDRVKTLEGALREPNLLWFRSFARKHGAHAQADWLEALLARAALLPASQEGN